MFVITYKPSSNERTKTSQSKLDRKREVSFQLGQILLLYISTALNVHTFAWLQSSKHGEIRQVVVLQGRERERDTSGP